MKSQEELFNMTVMELREYMNSLSNEEIKQAAEMFEYDEHERDPLTLLSAPKLFEYMQMEQQILILVNNAIMRECD